MQPWLSSPGWTDGKAGGGRAVTCRWPYEHTVPVLAGRERGTEEWQPAPVQAAPACVLQGLAELATGWWAGWQAGSAGGRQQQAEEPGQEAVAMGPEQRPPGWDRGLHLLPTCVAEVVGPPGVPDAQVAAEGQGGWQGQAAASGGGDRLPSGSRLTSPKQCGLVSKTRPRRISHVGRPSTIVHS